MQSSENPYDVLEVDDRALDVRTAFTVMARFGLVGLLCGLISGLYLERNARFTPSTAFALLLPGLVFGLGVMVSAIAFVRGRHLFGCLVLPLLAALGFAFIGETFDWVASTWPPSTPKLALWLVLSAYSSPGVLCLMLGCRLVAVPKSWLRFSCSGIVICLMSGAAPLVTNAAPGVYKSGPRFFITMFVVQVAMFLLFGWVLGDTIADDDEWTRAPEQAA